MIPERTRAIIVEPSEQPLSRAIASAIRKMQEDWIQRIMADEMPPEIFLRAYGHHQPKVNVATWMKDNGYFLESHPNGKLRLMHGEKCLGIQLPAI